MLKGKHPVLKQNLTFGQRSSDVLTAVVGSWGFIIFLLIFMVIWMAFNFIGWKNQWDPYPFILLNFVLSTLAAIQAPIILMSQNRTSERDRLQTKYDYQVDRKAEREIKDIQKDLKEIKKLLKKNSK
jgi:uncharacterized membrane protein